MQTTQKLVKKTIAERLQSSPNSTVQRIAIVENLEVYCATCVY
jgi:hypothetical protein